MILMIRKRTFRKLYLIIANSNIQFLKPRIAIIISHPIQHFCPQYVSFAKKKQLEIKVFFGSALGHLKYNDENFKQEISWNNLNLDQFPHVFLNGETVLQPNKDLDAPSLESELRIFQPNIIITYGYFQKLQRRAHHWAVKNRTPLVYVSDSELRHERNRLKESFKKIFIKKYFSKIDFFLSMGNANEDYYRHFGVKDNQIIRMHYPIDQDYYEDRYYHKNILRSKIRSLYEIAPEEVVLIVVGKLVSWKNQDHIIDAMKLLEDKDVLLHLFIIGSGEKSQEWKDRAAALKRSKVYFTGFVNIEALPEYYAAADVYIHPASMEPHSVAISEAIYMGTPVIISDLCGSYGAEDDVQEGMNGYVYPFGNIQSLATKIDLLLDTGKRKSFGEYSHQIAVSFQDRSHVKALDELIRKIDLK